MKKRLSLQVSFPTLAFLCLVMAGCATSIFSREGKLLFQTRGDASHQRFTYVDRAETITWDGVNLVHSTPTGVALHGASNVVGAAGLALAMGLSPTAHTLAPALATGAAQFKPAPAAAAVASTPKPAVTSIP